MKRLSQKESEKLVKNVNNPKFWFKYDSKKYLKKSKKFFKKHHFYPYEWWELMSVTAGFILPRLTYYRNHHIGMPCGLLDNLKDQEENDNAALAKWNEILDKMIFGFQHVLDENPDNEQLAREGLKLFGEYFFDLWD